MHVTCRYEESDASDVDDEEASDDEVEEVAEGTSSTTTAQASLCNVDCLFSTTGIQKAQNDIY